ncbi:hypothetical protein K9U39_14305 [Rhodoblastus acidophilus]|nr:hypothetical protein [Rhodoblastus acidophilus]
MTAAADLVIGETLLHGSPAMSNPPRTEVGLVASIVLSSVQRITQEWSPILASIGYGLKLSGVFCHAAPMVRFWHPSSARKETECELADLLVVVDVLHQSGGVERSASLVQAKMASRATRVTFGGKSSPRQLHLYQNWPAFSFADAVYGTRIFNLQPTCGEDAGTFGVIDRHLKNTAIEPPIWTQHQALPTPSAITTEPTLGKFVANMIGQTGLNYGRRAIENGADDWSAVVDLLMKVTYGKVFRHKPTLGNHAVARGATGIAFLQAAPQGVYALVESGGPPPPIEGVELIDDDDPGGMSVLRIVVAETGDGGG